MHYQHYIIHKMICKYYISLIYAKCDTFPCFMIPTIETLQMIRWIFCIHIFTWGIIWNGSVLYQQNIKFSIQKCETCGFYSKLKSSQSRAMDCTWSLLVTWKDNFFKTMRSHYSCISDTFNIKMCIVLSFRIELYHLPSIIYMRIEWKIFFLRLLIFQLVVTEEDKLIKNST